MAAYVATARIGRVDPHLTVRAAGDRIAPDPVEAGLGAPPIDVVESTWDDRFSERLADLQERWTQMTFFLFDAQSWRR